MDVLTIDFETYYDKDYSLGDKDTATWDYITDPRFEVIGVSVKVNNAPAQSFTGSFIETHAFLTQFDWAESAALCHHAAFDLAVLKWRFGITPKARMCTWSMCNALHGTEGSVSLAKMSEKYGVGVKGTERESAIGKRRADFTPEQLNNYMAYCRQDSDLTYGLFIRLMQEGFPAKELRVIDWTIGCYSSPSLVLDKELLTTELMDARRRKAAAWKSVGLADPAPLRKDEVLADMLRQFGVEPPIKTTEKGNQKYAFAKSDIEFLELREHPDDRVSALVDARLESSSSIEETRLSTLLRMSERMRNLPFPLTYFGASTGRWSGWDMINLQNLPKKGRIRECITVPPGKVLIAADLSQIELRVLSWVAGQIDVLETLRNGGDVYSDMATDIYGRPINKRDNPTERFIGKGVVLGGGFAAGWAKVASVILADAKRQGIVLPDTSDQFFRSVVSAYRRKNRAVSAFWNICRSAIERMAVGGSGVLDSRRLVTFDGPSVSLPRGIPMKYPDLRQIVDKEGRLSYSYNRYNVKRRKTSEVNMWHGLMTENIVQALARDIFAHGLLNCIDSGYPPCGAVHDELLFVVDESDSEAAVAAITKAMCTPPEWASDLPLDCEINCGKNYAEVK